jgi:hypothetical protein
VEPSAILSFPAHETVRRWRTNGWRPLDPEQDPLDAARAALDDAIPVLTSDPLTTARSILPDSEDLAGMAEMSDAELFRKTSRELAIAIVVVAQDLMLQPSIAVTRPREVSVLARALANCRKHDAFQATTPACAAAGAAAGRPVSRCSATRTRASQPRPAKGRPSMGTITASTHAEA